MTTIGESLESANYEIAQVSRPGAMLKYIKVSITTCHWQGGRFNKMDTYHILPCVFLVQLSNVFTLEQFVWIHIFQYANVKYFLFPIAVDCVWNEWQEWQPCNVTCGHGRKRRIRDNIPELFFGLPCEGPSDDWDTCSLRHCPGRRTQEAQTQRPDNQHRIFFLSFQHFDP